MIVLRASAESLEQQLPDPTLRELIAQRIASLEEFTEYDLDTLQRFVVVEPGDSLEAIDAELGFSVLGDSSDSTRFGQPGFTRLFELLEDHGAFYELVFIVSDDQGIELFVPKDQVNEELLAMCSAYASAPAHQEEP